MNPNGRLDSWKAIAAYLKRDERTVRRWEKEGLPVHRHMHVKKASVYAYPSEIDRWWNRDRYRVEGTVGISAWRRLALLLGACSVLLGAVAGWMALSG
jgi:hypothetical protein